jgi:HK97 gp10 family phage protein
MATFDCKGIDDLMLSMAEIAAVPEDIQDEMLNAQANIVERAQKSKGSAYGVHRTGVTLGSIKRTRIKRGKDGRGLYVYPQGKNADGNRNAEVAFINEFGKRGQSARPFINDANETSAAETTQAAFAVYDKWLKSKNL